MTGAEAPLDLAVFTRLTEAEAVWQQLKDAGRSCPYHSLAWLDAWTETLGKSLNISPVVAVGLRNGRPVVLLPLGLERSGGTATLAFLGHQHGNQNTGIWDDAFYDTVGGAQISAFLKDVCKQVGADLLKLENVPRTWHGRPHPLLSAAAAATPSPSPIFQRQLGHDFDQLLRDTHSKSSRKNLQRKERHLQAAGNYRVIRATSRPDIERGLSAFLEQRALRCREAGIPNVFDTPVAQAFLSRALGLLPENAPSPAPMNLWYLETGGAIRATYLCLQQAGTLYAYSNSIAHDDMLANSPGLVLVKEIIARACADPDLEILDLGLGEERYKTSWAEPKPLADCLVAVTLKGSVKRKVLAGSLKAKSLIRNSRLLWPVVRRLRKLKAGLPRSPDRPS